MPARLHLRSNTAMASALVDTRTRTLHSCCGRGSTYHTRYHRGYLRAKMTGRPASDNGELPACLSWPSPIYIDLFMA